MQASNDRQGLEQASREASGEESLKTSGEKGIKADGEGGLKDVDKTQEIVRATQFGKVRESYSACVYAIEKA